jgi:hypothetical protein
MKRIAIVFVFLFWGCTSIHSPYDLYTWCQSMGSTRIASVGPEAQNPANCERELQEDLADGTPRILFVPKDIIMSPVIAARAVWAVVGRTRPPF